MSTKIDKRIVEMKFDNAKFEKGVQTTLNTISKLKSSLKFDGASKSLKELEKAGGNFNLAPIGKSLDIISKRFSTFGIIGMTAIQEITKAAMNAGNRIMSSTFGQIITGGKTRALNIEQAKFMFEGLGMDVEQSMASANAAVKGTAYSLDQAAKAAGQFGASGMTAGSEMTSALRAIAGVAAMTSSEYDDIANIFTAVAGQGRLMGDQLLQLSGRGINAAATLGKAFGKTEKEIRDMVSKGEVSFEMFYKAMDNAFGKQATKANKTFTGALSNMKAALSRIGADVATPGIENLRKAINALTPVIDNVHTALMPLIGSIEKTIVLASKAARNALNGIDQKSLNQIGKGLNNLYKSAGMTFKFLGDVIGSFGAGLKEVLPSVNALNFKKATDSIKEFSSNLYLSFSAAEKFKMIGGSVANVIESVKNVIKALGSVAKPAIEGILEVIFPLKDSFEGLVPGGLIQTIYELTSKIREFTEGLKISDDTASKVKDVFKVIFTLFSTGVTIVANVAKVLGIVLFGALKGLSPVAKVVFDVFTGVLSIFYKLVSSVLTPVAIGFGGLANALEKFVTSIKDSITNGGKLTEVMNILKVAANKATRVFESIATVVSSVLSGAFGIAINMFTYFTNKINNTSSEFNSAGKNISTGFDSIASASKSAIGGLSSFMEGVKKAIGIVGAVLSPFINLIKRVIDEIHLDDILNVGSMVSGVKIFKSIENSFKSFENSFKSFEKATSGVTNALKGVAGALEEYQKNLKADTIKKIAVSVALLAGSIVALSMINPDNLESGFAAVSGLLAELVIAIKVVNDLKVKDKDILKVSASMVLVAGALTVLAGALKKLEGFATIGSIAPALIGISALLAGITIAMKALIKEMEQTTKDNLGSEMIKAGAAMLIISTALNVLATACVKLGSIDLGSLTKGTAAIVVLMASLSRFKNIYSDGSYAGMALMIMSIATSMLVLHKAITKFAALPLEEMNTGLERVRKVMLGLFLFLKGLQNVKMEGTAATIMAVAVALNLLLVPIKVLGSMDFGTLTQGLIATGLSLAAFTVALQKLDNVKISGGTSAAILALSVALVALVIPITILGSLPWQVVALGITAIVGAVALLGGVLALLSPAASGMMAVSAAFAVFGGAIALVGGGVLAFAAGLTLLATSAGLTTAALMTFIATIPVIVAEISRVLQIIASMAPGIGESLKTIGLVIVDVLGTIANEIAAKIVELLGTIVRSLAEQVIQNGPIVIQAIGTVIRSLLDEIGKTIPSIVELGVKMITELAKGFAKASSSLVKSGVTIVKNFLKGVRDLIPDFVETGVTFITSLLKGIEKTVPQIMKTATTIVKEFLKTIRDLVPDIVETGFTVIQGLLDGIKNHIKDIVTTAADIVTEFINGISEKLPQIIEAGMNMMIEFINGLANAIDTDGDRAVDAVFNLFESIVKLIINTIKKLPAKLFEWGVKAIKGFIKGIKDFKKNLWPTIKEFIDGIIKRIKELPGKLVQAGKDAIEGFIKGVRDKIGAAGDAIKDVADSAVSSIKDFLGIHSPSRVFKLIGNNTVQGFVDGIVENAYKANSAMKVLAKPTEEFAEMVKKNMVAGSEAIEQFYEDMLDITGSKMQFNTAIKNMSASMNAFTKSLYKNSSYYKEDLQNTKELAKNYENLQKEEKKLRKEQSEKLKEYKKAQAEAKKTNTESKKKEDTSKDDTVLKLYESRKNKAKETDSTLKVIGDSISKSVEKVKNTITKSNKEIEKSDDETNKSKKENTKASIKLDEESEKSSTKSTTTKKKNAKSEKNAYQNATKNLKKNLKEQAQARKDIADQEQKILENQAKALKDWQNNIKDAIKSFIDLSKMEFETGVSLTEAFSTESFDMTTEEALKNSKENLEAYKKWLEDLKILSAMGYDEAIVQTAKDAGYQNQAYLRALMGATKEDVAQFNKDMEESQSLSADKLISEAKEKAKKVQEWSKNIQEMSKKGFSQALIQSIVEAGPEASAEIASVYASMTDSQVREINKFEKNSKTAMNQAINRVTYSTAMAGSNGASKAAKEFVNGYSEEVSKTFSKKTEKSAKNGVSALEKTVTKSSKKSGKKSGKKFISSFITGMKDETPKAKEAAEDFTKQLAVRVNEAEGIDKAKAMFPSSMVAEFKKSSMEVGKAVGDGISEGVENSTKTVEDAVGTFADNLKTTMLGQLDLSKISSSIGLQLTEAFSIDTDLTTKEALKNSQANLTAYKKWLEDLQALTAMGYDEAIVETVKSAGYQNQKYLHALLGATEQEVTKFNKGIQEKQKLSADQLIADAKEKARSIEEWSKNIREMSAKGFNQSLIQSLAEAGPEASAELVSVYASMTATQVQEINKFEKTSKRSVQDAVNSVAETLGLTGREKGSDAAEDFVGAYAKQIANGLSKDVVEAANNGLTIIESEISNKSKKSGKKSGKKLVSSFILGMQEETPEVKEATKELSKQMARGMESVSGIDKAKSMFSAKIINEFQNEGKKIGEAVGEGVEEGIDISIDTAEESVEKFAENLKSSVESFIDPLKASASTGIDIFKEFSVETDLTGAQLLLNMRSQIDGMKQWKNDLNSLAARGLAPELIEKLRDLGVSSAEQIKAFKEMTLDEIQAANEAMTEALSLSADQVLEEQRRKTEQALKWSEDMATLAGKGISQGLLKGLAEQGIDGSSEMVAAYLTMTPQQIQELNANYEAAMQVPDKVAKAIEKSYEKAGSNAVQEFADAIGSLKNEQNNDRQEINTAIEEVNTQVYEDTTENFSETGKDADKELSKSLTRYKNDPTYAAEKVSSSVYGGLTSNLNYSSGMNIGYNVTDGMADGIRGGGSSVINAAIAIAEETIRATEEVLDINSPSKEFETIGKFTVLGMVKGLKNSGVKVVNESKSMTQKLIETTQDAIDRASSLLNDGINLSPVITPVIDLNRAMDGIKKLNSQLTKNNVLAMNKELGKYSGSSTANATAGKADSVVENTYNFTQNNYSPKELSRIDIYRQTRSQFAQFTRRVENA